MAVVKKGKKGRGKAPSVVDSRFFVSTRLDLW